MLAVNIVQKLDPRVRTSALISPSVTPLHFWPFRNSIGYSDTVAVENGTTSPWQAGIQIGEMPGTIDVKIADAAHSIKANILSPSLAFITQAMIARAHELKMRVIPWTVRKCLS